MNEERMKVLQMLQEGKLSIEEAMRLLEAMESPAVPLVTTMQPALVEVVAQPPVVPTVATITPYTETGVIRRRDPALKLGLNLEGARLLGVNLDHADFQGADLRNLTLIGANLDRVKFRQANLQGRTLLFVNLDGAVYREGLV